MSLTYNDILVAVDGSKESEKAFTKAIEIAKRNDAKLIITHIVDTRTFSTVEVYDRTLTEKAENFAKELLKNYQKQATDTGIKYVQTIIEYGSPKENIAKEIAPKHNIDLIICGAKGLNAVERFFIGSVSENITRYAKCDVLVVRN